MGEVISLNKYRKQSKRSTARNRAAVNRVKEGRTKAEKVQLKQEAEQAEDELENKKLGNSGEQEEPRRPADR